MKSYMSKHVSRYRAFRSERRSSYRPIGSDDGHDYRKDNRNGEVDDYVKFVEQWRKNQAKDNTPQ